MTVDNVGVLVQTSTPRFTVPASAYTPQLPFTTTLVADDLKQAPPAVGKTTDEALTVLSETINQEANK